MMRPVMIEMAALAKSSEIGLSIVTWIVIQMSGGKNDRDQSGSMRRMAMTEEIQRPSIDRAINIIEDNEGGPVPSSAVLAMPPGPTQDLVADVAPFLGAV